MNERRRWVIGSVVVPIICAMLGAGAYYWEQLGHAIDWLTGSGTGSTIGQSPEMSIDGRVIQRDYEIRASTTKGICNQERVLIRFELRYVGTTPQQLVNLELPEDVQLTVQDTIENAGCSITLIEVKAGGTALFSAEWIEPEN